MRQTAPQGVPVSAVDPFSDDFLSDPFRWHGGLRDAGPVVWLEHYGIRSAGWNSPGNRAAA